MSWTTHKFGGSSLANARTMARVAALLADRDDDRQAIVVSAMAGVTDRLIALTRLAAESDPRWRERLAELRQDHVETADALLDDPARAAALIEAIEAHFAGLEQLLAAVALMGTVPVESLELISGSGEVLSAMLLGARLDEAGVDAKFMDAREVLRVRPTELMQAVDWERSRSSLEEYMRRHPARHYVITGYVCRLDDGRVSTLGRNGSDYSASIFARLLDADGIHLWTDVDGLMSADPCAVPQALLLDHLSYNEAFELAYFGARVIHPQALSPAEDAGIPVWIRNTFHPDCPGTRIDAGGHDELPVKGISGLADMALVTLEGAGMIGVPGTAERVFSALNRARISVTMISQGSSEHSICLVVPESGAATACRVLEEAFERELRHGQIRRVISEGDIRVLAIVGDGMAGTPGIAARLFTALDRAGINVRAMAQGASERNISVAIAEADAGRAIKAIHAGFYLSDQTLSVGLIGPGNVGRALTGQIQAMRERLLDEASLDLRLRAVAGSRRMHLSECHQGGGDYDEQAVSLKLERFVEHVDDDHVPHAVIIDCTASDAIASHYADWLARGIHVITPNKHAGAGPLDRYRSIRAQLENSSARWRYEATVGAGLPVIQTLRDLIDTGDRIVRIDGILSGTLAWLFNRYRPGMSFAGLVREARAAGYTEPDPREDLSGMDVARKLVILAREMGLAIELHEVDVESLMPEGLAGVPVDDFLQALTRIDPVMAERLEQAGNNDRVLRYVASLDDRGKASVTLEALPGDHPFAHLALTDNVVAFTTERYRDHPLIVQGPGAGPEVTAAGVFADLLRVAAHLGARL